MIVDNSNIVERHAKGLPWLFIAIKEARWWPTHPEVELFSFHSKPIICARELLEKSTESELQMLELSQAMFEHFQLLQAVLQYYKHQNSRGWDVQYTRALGPFQVME